MPRAVLHRDGHAIFIACDTFDRRQAVVRLLEQIRAGQLPPTLFEGADLSDMDLTGLDFSGVSLRGALLDEAAERECQERKAKR